MRVCVGNRLKNPPPGAVRGSAGFVSVVIICNYRNKESRAKGAAGPAVVGPASGPSRSVFGRCAQIPPR